MTTKKDEEAARLQSAADFLLRESGFDSSGAAIPGKLAKERRRGAAIRLGKHPEHFEKSDE
jgi:hypothetical protein